MLLHDKPDAISAIHPKPYKSDEKVIHSRNKKLNMKVVHIITLATIAHGFGMNPVNRIEI